MKKHISYPKIGQFRNIVEDIRRQSSFVGLDENGEAIIDDTLPKPTLLLEGKVKVHGTNAGVSYNRTKGLWAQSRNRILTVGSDNHGFAFFVESKKQLFKGYFEALSEHFQIDLDIFTISVYGEWAGEGIQKTVGVSKLQKAFYIFGAKVSKIGDEDFKPYWIDTLLFESREDSIYNLDCFQKYALEVDFNIPNQYQNKLIEITEAVEKECPVAKELGIPNGVGEGVVWSVEYKGTVHRFKVKGEKHSVSKVKRLASADTEKMNSIQEFVEYAVTENRFNQAIEETFGKEVLDIKKIGDIIRWVREDVMSEELDTMADNGLEPKDVNKFISDKVKNMFFNKLQKLMHW